MIKNCKYCGRKFSGNGKRKYCSPRCKKQYENSLRSAPDLRGEQGTFWTPSETICRPAGLNGKAAEFWDKVAPTVISRGHLNVLSEDSFAELCDLYSRLNDLNRAIDEASIKASAYDKTQVVSFAAGLCKQDYKRGTVESALSELKRQYSKQFLEYCKEFYLTPKANRGNYQLSDGDGKQEQTDSIFD